MTYLLLVPGGITLILVILMLLNTLQIWKKKVSSLLIVYLCSELLFLNRLDNFIFWFAGKINTVGLTNFDTERLQIILENGIPIVSNQVIIVLSDTAFLWFHICIIVIKSSLCICHYYQVQHSLVDMRPQQKMAELCQLTGVKLITSLFFSLPLTFLLAYNCFKLLICYILWCSYGTVMGGLLSEKFLDTNLSIPFAGPPLNTPSLQKYKRVRYTLHFKHYIK